MEILIFAIIAGAVALVFAAFRVFAVVREDQGNEAMQKIARAIQLGAATFLKREYAVLAVFVAVVFVVLLLFIDLDVLDKNPMESRFWNFESDAPAMGDLVPGGRAPFGERGLPGHDDRGAGERAHGREGDGRAESGAPRGLQLGHGDGLHGGGAGHPRPGESSTSSGRARFR